MVVTDGLVLAQAGDYPRQMASPNDPRLACLDRLIVVVVEFVGIEGVDDPSVDKPVGDRVQVGIQTVGTGNEAELDETRHTLAVPNQAR